MNSGEKSPVRASSEHPLGEAPVKMHDVQIYRRRIEIAVSDISFRHDRKFEHDVYGRDLAPLIETIN